MSLIAACLGGLAWSASEYAIHRFVGHGPMRRPEGSLLRKLTPAGLAAEFNAEHVAHHADTTYFAPTPRKLRAAAVAVPALGGLLTPFIGPRRAFSFAAGFAVTYGAYEVLHRRIHTHPPKGPYGRWARRHHLHHHHKTPKQNHGVTSPLFDVVFSTYAPPNRVKVPRAAAPTWMTDPATGGVRAELADDYEIVGRGEPAFASPPA